MVMFWVNVTGQGQGSAVMGLGPVSRAG